MAKTDYGIGYGKPPKNTRFKKGASGNPKGRPKGSRTLRGDLEDELYARVTVTSGGKQRSISRQQALVKALVNKALHSDTKSIGLLLNLMLRLLPQSSGDPVEVDLSQEDQAILDAFEARIDRKLTSSKKGK